MTSIRERDGTDMGPVDTTINDRTRVSLPLVFSIVTAIVAVVWSFASLSARVAVVETTQSMSSQRLQRIETKLDQLLERRP